MNMPKRAWRHQAMRASRRGSWFPGRRIARGRVGGWELGSREESSCQNSREERSKRARHSGFLHGGRRGTRIAKILEKACRWSNVKRTNCPHFFSASA